MKQLIDRAVQVFLVVAMLCLVGCGGPAPDEVAEECVDCLQKADFDGMRKHATGDFAQWLDQADGKYAEVLMSLGEKSATKMREAYDELKYELGDVKVEEEKAIVPLKINGQDTPIMLIKVNGKWRIERFSFPII